MIRIRRAAAATVVATAAVLGMAVLGGAPASASTPVLTADGTADVSGDGPHTERLCARLPKVETRIDRAVARINGGAEQRGSLAFLNKRADQAKTGGNDSLAELLRARVELRTDRLEHLTKAKALVEKTKAERCGGK